MRSGVRNIVGIVGAIAAAACVDLAAPKGSPASISQIQLGAFYVVAGDTMRDTLGHVTPPTIIAYDAAGKTVSSYTPAFFITDSLQQLHFSAVNGALVSVGASDTAGATVHIVGQIGSLQTAVQTVYVTVRPDTLLRVLTATVGTDTLFVPGGVDSASSLGTLALSTVVHGVDGRIVPGVFVRYSLASTFASKTSSPAIYLRDDANDVFLTNQSSPDTGDASGVTSRTLVATGQFIADSTFRAGGVITVDVVATALYKGTPLVGSPLHLLVPVKLSFK